ncbi:YggS family pyridoxal phosphate-dependent enzyme [Adhaeribacter pallidiroseus]|uniref:Pyridoxal phosphate homeostasis protein n=1 Tax=Adhaeribacter pallidiroseus TaxID=2072847 RepID=A0A369QCI7_9BACT|nr:YggS family pyridoxal phosphate-dependent enzyme [Adhaeribacter pallidiroseus]RDC62611.1 Proline synthase co-transcribed bacterial like protein [Adhaeribacter pallidiroseus]
MNIEDNIRQFQKRLANTSCKLVAVSKTQPIEALQQAYNAGQRIFGENKAQEMAQKAASLPPDIEWHMLGHLQTNKVKYIAPFVHTIQSVDSLRLLEEIDKQAGKNNRFINCLLQIYIAQEETKFGLSVEEARELLATETLQDFRNIVITGVMGIATNTSSETQIQQEFKFLKNIFINFKKTYFSESSEFKEISMGMSSDYQLAIVEGSTMIRVGSSIFGARN